MSAPRVERAPNLLGFDDFVSKQQLSGVGASLSKYTTEEFDEGRHLIAPYEVVKGNLLAPEVAQFLKLGSVECFCDRRVVEEVSHTIGGCDQDRFQAVL